MNKIKKLTVSKADVEKSSILQKKVLRYFLGGYDSGGGSGFICTPENPFRGNYVVCCGISVPVFCSPFGIVTSCGNVWEIERFCPGSENGYSEFTCYPNCWY